MPRLSPFELNKKLDEEDASPITEDELSGMDYEDYLDERLHGELGETNISRPDTVKVLGMVVEPYVGKVLEPFDDDLAELRYRYQIGVLDTESDQKYVLHLYQHYFGSGESSTIFKITEMNEDLEYTHKPKKETFIEGFSIIPHADGPRWHQSSFQKIKKTNLSEDDDENRDRIVNINGELYRVHSLRSNQVANNVFHCTMISDWDDYGSFTVNTNLFKIIPEMAEKFKEKVKKVRLTTDYRSNRERIEQSKVAFRAHEVNEQKRKKEERAKARAEIKMYEESRKGRRKTALDEVVINRLKDKQTQK